MDFLKDFGLNPVLLAAQVVNFLILLWILNKFLYGPILGILQKRKEMIAKTIKNAEESERILSETDEKADRIIEKALDQSKKILDDTNQAAAQILEDTNKAAEEILRNAQKEALSLVDIERVVLNQEIKKHVGSLVVLIFEKITGQSVRPKQKEIIEKEVKNIS